MEKEAYNAMVDKYLSEDSNVVFGNFSEEHAGYIITRFLESAQNSVAILSGSFSNKFYSGLTIRYLLAQTATRIKANNGKIRIITADGGDSKRLEKIIDEMEAEGIDNIEYSPAEYNGSSPVSHFLVVDAKRYRLEAPHSKAGDEVPDCVKAEVCCNGRTKASELQSYFDAVWRVLNPTKKEQVLVP